MLVHCLADLNTSLVTNLGIGVEKRFVGKIYLLIGPVDELDGLTWTPSHVLAAADAHCSALNVNTPFLLLNTPTEQRFAQLCAHWGARQADSSCTLM